MSESPRLYDLYEKISRDLDELGLKGPCRSYVSHLKAKEITNIILRRIESHLKEYSKLKFSNKIKIKKIKEGRYYIDIDK